jgi:serine/threonine protein phosphatase PrpC
LTETKNVDGSLYGEKRLVDFIQQNARIEPENLIKRIWNDIVTFSHSEIFDDDVTCVLVKIDKESSSQVKLRAILRNCHELEPLFENFLKEYRILYLMKSALI